ncbi:MAG: porin [Cyanobacteria bacterium P01_A01_bin.123]
MRNLCPHSPSHPNYPSDRAGANRLIQLVWLSFGLTLGFYPFNRAALAAIVESDPNLSEFAIASVDAQSSIDTTLVAVDQQPTEPTKAEPTAVLERIAQTPDLLAEEVEANPVAAAPLTESAEIEPTVDSDEPITQTSETLPAAGNTVLDDGVLGDEALGDAVLDDAIPAGTVVSSTESMETALPVAGGERVAQMSEMSTDAADLNLVDGNAAPPSEPTEPLLDYQPLLEFQAVTILQNNDFSGRLRATGIYAINEQVLFGATVDLTTGEAFVDSRETGLSLNELYVAAAPIRDLPNLRMVAGLMDLTSYFDRNSFAKDGATHFFNPVFQTNPALSATGITSRPGLLVNWGATDYLELKAAAFSSSRGLGDFAIDGFAGEVGFRVENLIVRGTYATARDAGEDDGFREIFQLQRSDGSFGLLDGDREVAYGINAEYFIDALNIGVFGRYGWYDNQDLDRGGSTFSLGMNALDVFTDGDRLGLAYGQELSNRDLRTGATPDVWELLYDAPIFSWMRAGVSLQSRNQLSDTFIGLRLRADW